MSDARLLTLSSVLPFFGAFGHAACIVMWAPRLGTGIDVTYCSHFVNTVASNSNNSMANTNSLTSMCMPEPHIHGPAQHNRARKVVASLKKRNGLTPCSRLECMACVTGAGCLSHVQHLRASPRLASRLYMLPPSRDLQVPYLGSGVTFVGLQPRTWVTLCWAEC